mgnify:CR=1 FL=1
MTYFDGTRLNYSFGDEDARIEHALLPLGASHAVMIAGCGSRLIPCLARRPRRLWLVDTSAAQLALTELRLAALRTLEQEEYVAFLGYDRGALSGAQRQSLFRTLKLSDSASAYLESLFERAGWAPIAYLGRFERMLQTLARLTRLLTGKAGQRLFSWESLEQQRRYFQKGFPRRGWKLLVSVAGNSSVLNKLLYRGEFPEKNINKTYYELYRDITEGLINDFPARTSPFLQMIFFGHLPFAEGYPIECSPELFSAAKEALAATDLSLHQRDVFDCLAGAERPADFLALSDLPSFLPNTRARDYLQLAAPALCPGAMVVTRAHMRIVAPLSSGYMDITRELDAILATDRTRLWQFSVFRKSGSL